MIVRLSRFLTGSVATALLSITLVLTVALHWRIHASLLAYPWPITLRESAFILQTEALLNPAAPPQYSQESVPEDTNLYGPIYPLFAAPFVALIPKEPYLAHRVATGLCLGFICALLAWSAARGGGRLIGFIAAGIFYCATVGSPSLAAGQDNLATLFYVAAIIWIRHIGCGLPGLIGSVALGFLALMTKPYAVWILPCLVVYVAWQHSLLRGIILGTVMLVTGVVWAWAAQLIWPEYFFSVFFVHSQAAMRHFFILQNQVIEFSGLYFAPILILALFCPYQRLIEAAVSWRLKTDPTQVNSDHDQRWLLFMTAGASAPLLLSMGWHPGAHLIYFNHLLLPPLLLAASGLCANNATPSRSASARFLFGGNLVLLIFLCPAMPPPPAKLDISLDGPVLADPILEPLRRLSPQVDIVDNGQAQYWMANALKNGTAKQKQRALAWESELEEKIASAHYKTLLLAPSWVYQRRPLWSAQHMSSEMEKNYEMSAYFLMNYYYGPFRNRSSFGRQPIYVFIFSRKNSQALPEIVSP